MKNIDQFILEKFRITKDTEVDEDIVIDKLVNFLCIDLSVKSLLGDTSQEKVKMIKDSWKDWLKTNNIDDKDQLEKRLYCYPDHIDDAKNSGEYDDCKVISGDINEIYINENTDIICYYTSSRDNNDYWFCNKKWIGVFWETEDEDDGSILPMYLCYKKK